MTEREKALQEFKYFKEMGYGHADLPSSGSIELALSALESPRDWTPCAEGLPIRPEGKEIKRDWYIVTLETGMVTLRAYEFDERSPFGYGFHEQNIIPVIAWQPLPATYRADDTTGKVKEDAEKESHNPQECKNCDVDRDLHKSYLTCTKHHGGIDRDPNICDGCADFRFRQGGLDGK